jgi:glycosyltransferase involved in cell wall biosynthesis
VDLEPGQSTSRPYYCSVGAPTPASFTPLAQSYYISIVEPSGLLYGSELALADILQGLDRSQFRTEVILPACAPLVPRLSSMGVRSLELLPASPVRRTRFVKVLSYLRVMRHWSTARPHLIYVNQAGIFRPIAAIAKCLRLPLVCQVQTLEDARWVSGMGWLHRQAPTFIANSQFIASETHVPRERLSVLYQGYRYKGLKQSHKPRHETESFEIGLLGRICESKGHYLMVSAAKLVRARTPKRLHIRFIGSAPSATEQRRIEAFVREYGVTDMIEFRGYRSDIAGELAQLDLVVIPSLGEAYGRVFFEAAEAEVPVLLAASGGLDELSRHFGVGERFTDWRADDLANALERVVTKYPTVRRAFVSAAKQMLNALNFDAYLAICSDILRRACRGEATSIKWLGNLK